MSPQVDLSCYTHFFYGVACTVSYFTHPLQVKQNWIVSQPASPGKTNSDHLQAENLIVSHVCS